MEREDTIRLLQECDAGAKMGGESIAQILSKTQDPHFRSLLALSEKEHRQLEAETGELLKRFGGQGKEPNAAAKAMSWMKTSVKLAGEGDDAAAADLIADGCSMGVKTLIKNLNRCVSADPEARNTAKRLIQLEDELAVKVRDYL